MKSLFALCVSFLFLFPITEAFRQDNVKGKEAFKKKNFEKALRHFNESLKSDELNPKILYNIANAHLFKGNHDEAIKYFDHALKNLTGNESENEIKFNAYFNLGNSHFHKQQYKEAIQSYKKGLGIDRSNVGLKKNLELAIKKLQTNKNPDKKTNNQKQKRREKNPNQSKTPEKNEPIKKSESPEPLNSAKGILENFENRQQNSLTKKRYQEKKSKRKLEKNW